MQNHFSQKIYISGFGISFSDILKQCKGWYNTVHDDNNTQLAMLKQNLSSERFLLFIDNCTSLIEPTAWNTLWGCLSCAKKGSKIILTFEDDYSYNYLRTFVNFGSVSKINIDAFSEEEYLSFFYEHAFGTVDPKDYPELAIMGAKIAWKMIGSIWGAKIIGELLRDNLVPQFWSNLLRDDILSSQFQNSKKPWPAIDTIVRLLPKRLHLSALSVEPEKPHNPFELKYRSYRDLIVVGSNLFRPHIKDGRNLGVEFVVTKSIFLSECTIIKASVPSFRIRIRWTILWCDMIRWKYLTILLTAHWYICVGYMVNFCIFNDIHSIVIILSLKVRFVTL